MKNKKKIVFKFYFYSRNKKPSQAYLMMEIGNKKRILDSHNGCVSPMKLGEDYDFEYAKYDLFYGRPLIKKALIKAGYDVVVINKEEKLSRESLKYDRLHAHLTQAEKEKRFDDIFNIINNYKNYKQAIRKTNKEYL